jgi:hypothetical protein
MSQEPFSIILNSVLLPPQNVRNERMIHHPVDCPPGMRLMKPEEREATASELERVRIKLLKALSQVRNSYPVSFPSSAIALTTHHRILWSGISPLCATNHFDSAVQSIALTAPHRIPFSAGQLPFLCDTPSLKSKKEALEEKLQQVCAITLATRE